ncbi:uncharacterized protein LOC116182376 [Photinus pyralis]|uniref:uncharacterized protein LOC116182376 n=1 Tax=Photinus pyralis TaxID=7054 RepID=UPI0012676723|nr:uncharacterized protein LOC116182376 [Photinus pyralis]
MVLTFVKSQKGNNMLILNGFIHKKERIIEGKIIWKCASYNKCKCPGRVHTFEGEVVKSTSHNHVADAAKLEARSVCNDIKRMAQQVEPTTQAIVGAASEGLSLAGAGQLPSVSSLKRTIQRARNRYEAIPANPINLTELVLPPEYTVTNNGEPFLLFDSGPGEQRNLLFSSERNLTFMEH